MAYQTHKPAIQNEVADPNILKMLAPWIGGAAGLAFGNPMLGYQAGNLASQFLRDGGKFNQYTGPTHEQGGTNINVAEVEGGETSLDDMVFSDNLKVPGTKKTFAEVSKKINNRYKRREHDAYAKASKERELKSLFEQQEQLKIQEQPVSPEAQQGMQPNPQQMMAQGQGQPMTEGLPMMSGGGLTPPKKSGLTDSQMMGIGYGAQALSNLPMLIDSFKKPEQVNYGRVAAPTVDLSPSRDMLSRDRTTSRNAVRRSAQRLDNPYGAVSAMAGAADPYAELIDQSFVTEKNQNAQLGYDASKTNTQIRMQEIEANQRNKDAQTSMRHQAFSNLGAIAGTGVSDYMSNQMMNKQLDMQKEYWDRIYPKQGTTEVQSQGGMGGMAGTTYNIPPGNYPAPEEGSLVFTPDGQFIKRADGTLVPVRKKGGKLPKRSYRRKY